MRIGSTSLLGQLSRFKTSARILEHSMGARNGVGTGLLYRPSKARICKS
jgi:hypothetical protein